MLNRGESVSTKLCKNCGKELPVESVFCPYCMTKLIDVKTGTEIKSKKKNVLIPVLAIVAVLIVSLLLYFVLHALNNNSGEQVLGETVSESSTPSQSEIDYSSYMGIWCDEGTNADSIALEGGRMVEVVSVNDDLVRFTYTKISSAPHNRIAIISNVNTQIVDGVGTFTFDDDGWGNSGKGKIKLLDNEIYLETNITSKNESSMWDIEGQVYLTKDDETIFDLRFSESGLGKDFDEVKSMYGEEIKDSETVMNNYRSHYYDGFRVDVDLDSNKVIHVAVDYLQPGFAKTSPCYGEINGNSNYDDVYRVHGEPNVNKLSEGYVAYNVDHGELRYFFDESLTVTGFSLQVNEQ